MTFILFVTFMHEELDTPEKLEFVGYSRIDFNNCEFDQFVHFSTLISRTCETPRHSSSSWSEPF